MTTDANLARPRTTAEAVDLVATVLARIAPDVDLATCDRRAVLNEQLDLDSMDFLTLVTRLAERIGRDIPERDYGRLVTLDDLAGYLVERAA